MKALLNRTLSVVLALVMCVGLLNLTAFAASTIHPCAVCGKETAFSKDIIKAEGKFYHRVCAKQILCNHTTGSGSTLNPGRYGSGGPGTLDCYICGETVPCPGHKDADVSLSGETAAHDHRCDYCHAEYYQWGVVMETTATCTQGGTTIQKCAYPGCNAVKSETQTGPLGHDCSKLVNTLTPATCTEPGTGVYQCIRCDHTEEKAIPSLGHDMVTDAYTAANCVSDGHEAGAHCSRCDAVTTGGAPIAPLGHDWSGWTATAGSESVSHTRTCQRTGCDGTHENPGTQTETHTGFQWGEWAECPTDRAMANDPSLTFSPGDVAEERTRECTTCNYSEAEYRKQGMKTVNVRYVVQGSSPEELLGTATLNFSKGGGAQDVEQKVFDNYTCLSEAVAGLTYESVTDGQIIMVLYAPISYTVTVHYLYANGQTAYGDSVTRCKTGDTFRIPSPGIANYTASRSAVSGTMGSQNLVFTVIYTYVEPQPPVVIEDPDVPLAEDPPVEEPVVEIEEPDVPLAEEPDVEIEEPDVPMAEEPAVEIEEPNVPLADVPETGDRSLLWGGLTLISGSGLVFLAVKGKKRQGAGE